MRGKRSLNCLITAAGNADLQHGLQFRVIGDVAPDLLRVRDPGCQVCFDGGTEVFALGRVNRGAAWRTTCDALGHVVVQTCCAEPLFYRRPVPPPEQRVSTKFPTKLCFIDSHFDLRQRP